MPTITANMTVTLTVAQINGQVFDAILTWIKENVKDKLPENADLVVQFVINT